MVTRIIETPAGELELAASDKGITLCDWTVNRRHVRHRLTASFHYTEHSAGNDLLNEAVSQIQEYFSGRRLLFTLPLYPHGSTFRLRVWEVLKDIPYGTTLPYSRIAEAVGMSRGVRAVAQAIGDNPLSILIPCHRVISSNGSTGGYAGGIEAKKFLLELEKSNLSLT